MKLLNQTPDYGPGNISLHTCSDDYLYTSVISEFIGSEPFQFGAYFGSYKGNNTVHFKTVLNTTWQSWIVPDQKST